MNSTKQCSCLVLPPGELHRNITLCLILAHWPYGMKTCRHPQNRKYITYRNAVTKGLKHGHRQQCIKTAEVRTYGF